MTRISSVVALFSPARVEAVLAIHGAVAAREEGDTRRIPAAGADRVVHHPYIAAVLVGRAGLRVFAEQEGIERVRPHIQIHQIPIATGAIALATLGAE